MIKVCSDLPETLGYAHQRQEKPNTERMETQRMAQHFKMILSGVPETLFQAQQRQEKPNTERMETQRMAQHSKMIISGVLETLPRLNSDKKNLTLKEWRLKEWLNILR